MATDPPSPSSRMHSPNYQRQRTPATNATATTPTATITPTAAVAAAAAQASSESLASNGYRPLNVKDALTYLDQVKVKFADQPEVYNRFLDIMKEFKSQAIDTPGVIERVSTLFRGHPALISGFNTFLPPGYRIECSTDDHARDIIRVTTPTGTTSTTSGEPLNLQSETPLISAPSSTAATVGTIPSSASSSVQAQAVQAAGSMDQARYYHQSYVPSAAYRNTVGGPLPSISSYHPSIHPPPPQHAYPGTPNNANNVANTAAVSNGSNVHPSHQHPSASAHATHHHHHHAPPPSSNSTPLQTASPSTHLPASSSGINIQQQQQQQNRPHSPMNVDENATRRAPVEFNHAINYVNKIKNRFSNDPETYKQFLEILQTYQKEQKPIQEVYAQVQILFNGANDLLGEFKQFLPDTTATSNSSNHNIAEARAPPTASTAHTTSTTHVGRKRMNNIKTTNSKRTKMTHSKASSAAAMATSAIGGGDDISDIRSSALLRPLISPDEHEFFDRVRKFIGHKATYHTFLKLLQLYSQQIVDGNTLVHRCEPIIGSQKDLFNTLKKMVGYDGQDQVIENIPCSPSSSSLTSASLNEKLDLSKCKEYGPSYRLVPRSWGEQQCSGRDSLCWEVLNDDYVSHPTWNSEDSQFIASKKNQYEEALHRVEDERYEYDLNIEANLNTISLLEPVSKKLSTMSEEEKSSFRLPPGLGGPSKTIYQRIIKKIYGKAKSKDIVEMLHSHPAQAVPIVLKRLKQKDEEWKKAQREWNKVWREIEIKNYYRSLDYQGVIFKLNDRKQMTVKSLVTEIEAIHADQLQDRLQRPQFCFEFKDKQLFKDVTRILFSFFERQATYNVEDCELMRAFVEMFLPVFFDLPDVLPTEIDDDEEVEQQEEEDEEDEEEETQSHHSYDSELSNARRSSPRRGRRSPRHKPLNDEEQPLLRDVLTRSIKNATPEDDMDNDEEKEEEEEEEEEETAEEENESKLDEENNDKVQQQQQQQQEVPTGANNNNNNNESNHSSSHESNGDGVDHDDEQKEQKIHRFFGNTAFYCFFRLLEIAYNRLGTIKSFDQKNKPNAEKAKQLNKTALELNLSSKNMYSVNIDFKFGYYKPMLKLIDRFFDEDVDQHVFEECARYIYGNNAYLMFTIDRLMSSITRQLHSIVTEPKAQELLSLYKKNHQHEMNTSELTKTYRLEVSEILNTDDGLYNIAFDTLNRTLSIQILSNNDEIFELNDHDSYNEYVTSYTDWEQNTLGVNQNDLSPRFLKRNFNNTKKSDHYSKNEMQYKICRNTYHLFYMMDTEDVLLRRKSKHEITQRPRLFKKEWIDIKDKSKIEQETRDLLS